MHDCARAVAPTKTSDAQTWSPRGCRPSWLGGLMIGGCVDDGAVLVVRCWVDDGYVFDGLVKVDGDLWIGIVI